MKRIINGEEVWVEEPIEGAALYYRVPYLVIPRVLVTNMPYEWQEKFVALAEELREAWDWSQIVNDYTVLPKRGGKFTRDELRNYRHFPIARVEELRTNRGALAEEEGKMDTTFEEYLENAPKPLGNTPAQYQEIITVHRAEVDKVRREKNDTEFFRGGLSYLESALAHAELAKLHPQGNDLKAVIESMIKSLREMEGENNE